MSPRWDLVYKWADPDTRSLVDAVTSALENCDRKLQEAEAAQERPADAALREAAGLLAGSVRRYFDDNEAKAVVNMQPLVERIEELLAAQPTPSPEPAEQEGTQR